MLLVPGPIPPDLNVMVRLASASVMRDSTGSCWPMRVTSSGGRRSIGELEHGRFAATYRHVSKLLGRVEDVTLMMDIRLALHLLHRLLHQPNHYQTPPGVVHSGRSSTNGLGIPGGASVELVSLEQTGCVVWMNVRLPLLLPAGPLPHQSRHRHRLLDCYQPNACFCVFLFVDGGYEPAFFYLEVAS
jgi:hypothetical protein